jgi:hypothetical protein
LKIWFVLPVWYEQFISILNRDRLWLLLFSEMLPRHLLWRCYTRLSYESDEKEKTYMYCLNSYFVPACFSFHLHHNLWTWPWVGHTKIDLTHKWHWPNIYVEIVLILLNFILLKLVKGVLFYLFMDLIHTWIQQHIHVYKKTNMMNNVEPDH